MTARLTEEQLDEILQRDFTSSFRRGYVKVKGFTMPKRFEELQDEIHNWDVRNEDIWICSFPKTGTTWTQEMIWMIVNNLDFDGGQVNLGIRSPFLEVSALYDFRQLKKDIPDFEVPPFLDDSLKFVKDRCKIGPQCIKSHLPWDLLPRELQASIKSPKIIYVTRNPKDTCISYFNHSRLMEGYRGDFNDFCELFLAEKLTYTPYWSHLLSFWQRRNQKNILFLKYEDMNKDLPAVIREVADFLEKPLSDEQVSILADHLSFENMKKNPAVNYEMVISINKKFKLTESDGKFMRSGKVGDYKANMSPEMIKIFDEWSEENLKDNDFSF
ncbi:unnamed protein product [Acanthoscelides obtectus]|uniref:Sulfotransferase domain-containing protein n=1 Tax=Acanthoscelides obtectus TaxID=200917 RepID=A0A9P0LRQ9_ACAOB|nr:unnamed protein product [Acanthoscelides obtectus]CAK1626611.1 Amine sulfotransferase [Acanthoscelides obtectus]